MTDQEWVDLKISDILNEYADLMVHFRANRYFDPTKPDLTALVGLCINNKFPTGGPEFFQLLDHLREVLPALVMIRRFRGG